MNYIKALLVTVLAGGLIACGAESTDSSTSSSTSSSSSSSTSSSSSSSSSSGGVVPNNSITIEELTDGYCSGNTHPIETEHGGMGSGYVNSENGAGYSIAWRVNAAEDNTYKLSIRFANGSGSNRGGVVTVNDNSGTTQSVQLADTGAWNTWASESVDVVLSQGENNIVLTGTGGEGLANIDSITVTGPGVSAVACSGSSSGSSASSSSSSSASSSASSASSSASGRPIDRAPYLEGFGAGATGGGGSNKVTVSSLSQLKNAVQSNVTIMVDGTISGSDMVEFKEVSNVSVIGVGSNGNFKGVGLRFIRTSNVIIQNLSFENSSDDSIALEDTTKAWVDHNTMSTDVNYLECGKSSVKDKYDGQIDIKKNSRNITVSYNYIHDACKAMLLGFSDGKELDDLITYHHNRFENIGSRLPLIRSADTHVYNNYYKNILISGINVRMGANALIENNWFDNVDDPILSADSDEIGYWNVSGNVYVPNGPQYTHQVEDVDVIGTVVNGEVQSTTSWRVNYNYQLDDTVDVPPTVVKHAGAGKL